MIIRLPGEHWKHVENRSRNSLHRGPLLIHSSGTLTRDDYENACATARAAGAAGSDLPSLEQLAAMRGGIIGAVRMYDVSAPWQEPDDEPSSEWRDPGCFAYHLSDRAALPFRACAGKLGVFDLPATPAELAALRAAGLAP